MKPFLALPIYQPADRWYPVDLQRFPRTFFARHELVVRHDATAEPIGNINSSQIGLGSDSGFNLSEKK